MKQSIKATLLFSALATCFTAFAQDVKVISKIPAEVEVGKEFTVELTIDKGDVSGFAKLQQELPSGLMAVPNNPNGSTFSFKDQKVKFLWMALPGDKVFKVSYNIKADASALGDQILEGSFSFIKDNETQKVALPKDIIKISPAGTAIANASAATPKVTNVDNSASTSTATMSSESSSTSSELASASGAVNAEAEALAKRKEEEAKVRAEKTERDRKAAEKRAAQTSSAESTSGGSMESNSSKNIGGLVYKVQVAATKRKVEGSEFKSQYNLSDEVNWEDHEGWNKYVVGSFQNYKAAKAYSNSVRDNNGVPGPFVTSYMDGSRITVQEALEKQGR